MGRNFQYIQGRKVIVELKEECGNSTEVKSISSNACTTDVKIHGQIK
jgi:hypothetical protein